MPNTIDHDALFKMLLSAFFREFLALFAEDVHQRISADPLIFLDKESYSDLLDPDRREADLVVQTRLQGHPTTVLIHLEHQAQADALLDRRMFRYFARFYDRYDTPIYPIVLCSYATPRRAAPDRHQVWVGQHVILNFQYQVVQLNQLDWRTYIESPNPVAAALMARMRIAATERWRVKAACLRLLAGLPLNGIQRRMIAQFVDQYLVLDAAQDSAFQAEVATFRQPEREVVMEIVTSWERKARAEGIKEGRTEGVITGQRQLVQRQLTRKFTSIPPELHAQIDNLTPSQLESFAEALLEFRDLQDAQQWLAALPEK
jgi:predicted transposase YdaD